MGTAYQALDDAIVVFIQNHPRHHPIHNQALMEISANELGLDQNNQKVWRLIDRRMQALRRAGRIKYNGINKGWAVI